MSKNEYHLSSFSAPTVTGSLLKIFHFILKYFGWMGITYKLFTDSNLHLLRKHPIFLTPTLMPIKDQKDPENTKAPDTSILKNNEYREGYLKKVFTPTDVANTLIKNIEHSQSTEVQLGAIIKYDKNDILKQAHASTERYRNNKSLGPLDGVPVAVKDEADMLPYETSLGTSFVNIKPDKDAFSVGKLRSAGAILFAKANMHENPYSPNHVVGGSSGGSACLVSSKLCPIAVGADGGGSIRIPSSFCGVYGLKPTTSRVSTNGSFPLALTVGVVGPIADTASNLALAYSIMAGPNPEDPYSLFQNRVSIKSFNNINDLSDLKIGIYRPYFSHAAKDIVESCYDFLRKLEKCGAKIIDMEIPHLEKLRVAHSNAITSEMLSGFSAFDMNKFSLPTQCTLHVVKANLGARDYIDTLKYKTLGIKVFEDIFKEFDLIVSPSTGITAPEIHSNSKSVGISDLTNSGATMRFIFLSNLLGFPSVTVPIGFDKKGLPVGFQFQAKWYNEDLLLRMANFSENINRESLQQVTAKINFDNLRK
ncbi:hypothetical protein HK099_006202 [Clydaea vesicula]|uniref:Amidase domain-containing protein n=1 Tax=Clydaea vesicula TaxID=447962 RepID=A0AAD5Y2M2_9FUNG|nr:hypothetical protein HK099_006202 [Clydaea vesicula]